MTMSRRTMLAIGARILPVAIWAATLVPLPLAAAPKDTVVIGLLGEPPVLDPMSNAAAVINQIVSLNVIENLTAITGDGSVVPGLATSWEISADGKVYRFKLREGVKFHDGTPFSAADVKFSFDRAMAPDSVNPTKKLFEPIAAIETPDPASVIITLKQPSSLFLFYMGGGPAGIVSAKTVESNKTAPVGTGPYKFKEWVKGDRVVLMRNDAYWNAKNVAIRQATFKFVDDPSAQVASLLAGDVDAYPNIGAPETLERFKADKRFQVVIGTTEGEVPLILNNKKAPFNDIRVRRALNHAIDRKQIIDGAQSGFGTPIGSHFPPHNPAYVDLTQRYPFDLAKAKALLAEAGFPNGFETTIKPPPFPYARRSAEIITAQLAAIGVRVKIEPVEWAQWLDVVYKQANYDMTIVAHVAPYDLDNYSRGLDYYYGYKNAAFDEIIQRLNAATDPAEMSRLFAAGQRLIAEDAVHVFLFQLAKTGVYAAGLEGFWANSPLSTTDLASLRWK